MPATAAEAAATAADSEAEAAQSSGVVVQCWKLGVKGSSHPSVPEAAAGGSGAAAPALSATSALCFLSRDVSPFHSLCAAFAHVRRLLALRAIDSAAEKEGVRPVARSDISIVEISKETPFHIVQKYRLLSDTGVV